MRQNELQLPAITFRPSITFYGKNWSSLCLKGASLWVGCGLALKG